MTGRAVRRSASLIDPMFTIPEGVDELVYHDEEFDVLDTEDSSDSIEFSVEGTSEDDETDYADAPETPQILGIVPPQVIRMGDSGAEVVDVVFEVLEVVGASNYEFRVTKV